MQKLAENVIAPTSWKMSEDFTRISRQLDTVIRVAPRVETAIGQLKQKLAVVRDQLAKNRSQVEAVRAADGQLREAQDLSMRRAHIMGRISLYTESLPELPETQELESTLADLGIKSARLEAELSDEAIQERLSSILARLSGRMSKWALELELEHSDASLRLDVKHLTVVADTDDGPVPMSQMGSAANWVGYHLIAHLALHEWFAKRRRPVPRFLFLDQPSQVYFPPEQDSDGLLNSGRVEDRTAVIRMFRLVLDVVQRLTPEVQVIITEHADIADSWYQSVVRERWRSG
jgi:hypothetical protein